MRATTVISLLLAIVLAGLAAFAARTWLITEREQIVSETARVANAEETAPKNTIVVAKSLLQFGERLTRDKLEMIEWASDSLPPGSFSVIAPLVSDDDEEARWVLASIAPGEPIFASKITNPGQRAKLSTALTPGMKAISIRVNDVLGVAGFVLPGDRVDIMLTRKTDAGSFVDVLLQGVKVLAIDQTADDRKDQPSVVRTVTFEVSTEEAQKLALGASVGTLSLALRNIASSGIEDTRRVTVQDLGLPDVADELIAETTPAASEPSQAEIERQQALEELLKGFMDDISERLANVETSIEGQEPVDIDPERIVEEIVEPPASGPAQKPTITTVGVIREGRRQEYRVIVDPTFAGAQ